MTSHPEARVAYLVRRRVLDQVGAIFADANVRALLVKGAGLAETVYPEPWRRTMADIDLIVRPQALAVALEALGAAGIEVVPVPPERRYSFGVFEERTALVSVGPLRVLVEVHTGLDKVVPHPIAWSAVWDRAVPVEGLPPSLLVPSFEDHVLLVVLHVALSEFEHPSAWDDLQALWHAGLDFDAVALRAKEWGLTLSLELALARLSERHAALDLAALRSNCPSSGVRSAIARRVFAHRGRRTVGLTWLAKQTVLREDPARWLFGLVRFAVLRGADRWPW